jgi:steroid 5-alpha reductase family enzyme
VTLVSLAMAVGPQLLWIAAGASVVMGLLWLWQLRFKNAGIVDVGWAACLGGAALFCGLTGEGDPLRRWLIASIGGIWGLRLALHLLTDRVLPGHEDGRYVMMRQTLGRRFQPVLFAFFQAQAVTVGLLALPFALAASAQDAAPRWTDLVGGAIWIVGLIGESVADAQLKRFKANPASPGRVCAVGLWRYSRHPNYFFEWLMWCAYAVVALPAPLGWLGTLAPLTILVLVTKLTGIPPTEARSVRSRGEAYRAYQRTTSAFFPWFPRPDPHDGRLPGTPSASDPR